MSLLWSQQNPRALYVFLDCSFIFSSTFQTLEHGQHMSSSLSYGNGAHCVLYSIYCFIHQRAQSPSPLFKNLMSSLSFSSSFQGSTFLLLDMFAQILGVFQSLIGELALIACSGTNPSDDLKEFFSFPIGNKIKRTNTFKIFFSFGN